MEVQIDPHTLERAEERGTNEAEIMEILYNTKTDLLYIRLDNQKQPVINQRLSEDIVLDIGEDDRIVGIEILDASRRLNLEKLLPVEYRTSTDVNRTLVRHS